MDFLGKTVGVVKAVVAQHPLTKAGSIAASLFVSGAIVMATSPQTTGTINVVRPPFEALPSTSIAASPFGAGGANGPSASGSSSPALTDSTPSPTPTVNPTYIYDKNGSDAGVSVASATAAPDGSQNTESKDGAQSVVDLGSILKGGKANSPTPTSSAPPVSDPNRYLEQLGWPSDYRAVTSYYGPRTSPTMGTPDFHTGIDFAGVGACGANAYAAEDGEVISAGWTLNGYGNRIIVKHTNHVATTYNHLSEIKVKVGDKVRKGDTVGAIGTTGNSTGCHLHFEVLLDEHIYTDPYPWLVPGAKPTAQDYNIDYPPFIAGDPNNPDTQGNSGEKPNPMPTITPSATPTPSPSASPSSSDSPTATPTPTVNSATPSNTPSSATPQPAPTMSTPTVKPSNTPASTKSAIPTPAPTSASATAGTKGLAKTATPTASATG